MSVFPTSLILSCAVLIETLDSGSVSVSFSVRTPLSLVVCVILISHSLYASVRPAAVYCRSHLISIAFSHSHSIDVHFILRASFLQLWHDASNLHPTAANVTARVGALA